MTLGEPRVLGLVRPDVGCAGQVRLGLRKADRFVCLVSRTRDPVAFTAVINEHTPGGVFGPGEFGVALASLAVCICQSSGEPTRLMRCMDVHTCIDFDHSHRIHLGGRCRWEKIGRRWLPDILARSEVCPYDPTSQCSGHYEQVDGVDHCALRQLRICSF